MREMFMLLWKKEKRKEKNILNKNKEVDKTIYKY